MGYHWGPDYRGFDPHSGEIGLGLYGYLNGIAVICFTDQVLGLTCYGGKARTDGDTWHVTLLDGVNRRLVFPKERIAVEIEGACRPVPSYRLTFRCTIFSLPAPINHCPRLAPSSDHVSTTTSP